MLPRKVDDRPLLDPRHTPWLSDAELLRSTNHLIVKKNQGPDDYDDIAAYERWVEPLCDLITGLGKLKTIIWLAGPVPPNILETIAKQHPSAQLKVFNHRRINAYASELDAWEDALAASPNLTHLRIVGHHNGEENSDYCMAAAKEMFARAPNLVYAGVIADCDNAQHFLHTRHVGSIETGGAEEVVPSRSGGISKTIRALTLDGTFKFNKATLDGYAQYVDVGLLETLKFSRGFPGAEYFKCAADMLPSLREVSLNFGSISPTSETHPNPVIVAAKEYVLSCTPLRTLSLWSWRKVVSLEELLNHHGQTLTSLQLHEKEPPSGPHASMPSTRQPVTPEEIRLIRQSCPKLLDLTIDLNREDEFLNMNRERTMQASMKELAAFDNHLFKLQIYLDSSRLWSRFYPQNGDWADQDDNVTDDDLDADGDDASDSSDGEHGMRRLPGRSATNDEHNSILRMYQRANRTHARRRLNATELMTAYVTKIWHKVFGARRYGERRLEVKFGEWEAKDLYTTYNPSAVDLRHLFQAIPHERDDRVGECQVSVYTKNSRLRSGATFNYE